MQISGDKVCNMIGCSTLTSSNIINTVGGSKVKDITSNTIWKQHYMEATLYGSNTIHSTILYCSFNALFGMKLKVVSADGLFKQIFFLSRIFFLRRFKSA